MQSDKHIIRLLILAAVLLALVGFAPQPVEPGFSDGVWSAVFVTSGPLTIGEAHANTAISGAGLIVVTDGMLSGDYTVHGSDIVIADGGSATGTMTSSGTWGGTATEPGYIDGNTSIEGTVTVDGVTQPISFSFPSSGTLTTLPIISATCTTVIADLETVANNMFAEVGVSSSLYGSFVAIRLLDALPGDEPPDYADEALALHLDGLLFYADVVSTGEVAYADLDALLTRAEDFYERMERAAECDVADADAWLGLMAGMVQDLLQLALDHPELFDDMDMLRLVSAGLRMGLFTGPGEAMPLVQAQLVADAIRRAAEAVAESDCDGAIAVGIIGGIVGGPEVGADLSGYTLIACGG